MCSPAIPIGADLYSSLLTLTLLPYIQGHAKSGNTFLNYCFLQIINAKYLKKVLVQDLYNKEELDKLTDTL